MFTNPFLKNYAAKSDFHVFVWLHNIFLEKTKNGSPNFTPKYAFFTFSARKTEKTRNVF